jgi:hypothetical protein
MREQNGAEWQLYPFLASTLLGGRWSTPGPGCLPPEKIFVTHCRCGCVGSRAGLDWYGEQKISSAPRDSDPVTSSMYRVAIPAVSSSQVIRFRSTHLWGSGTHQVLVFSWRCYDYSQYVLHLTFEVYGLSQSRSCACAQRQDEMPNYH